MTDSGMAAIRAALADEAIISFMEENIDIWSLRRINKRAPTERQIWERWKAYNNKAQP